ncbi:MucR family transcriptional regulator [Methylobacterium sp. E-065]|uniref:MucR family transcriptional regulator n=1 Tax=Methylobacterium sp. E-065 TaxID=2836583 RepID=UPI003918B9DA
MTDTHDEATETLAVVTAELVAAYVSNNPVPAAELPALIARVHGAVAGLVSGTLTAETGTAAQPDIRSEERGVGKA